MTATYHYRIHYRSKIAILTVLVTVLAFLLASCGTMQQREGLSLRASGGAGATHVKGEVDDPITGQTESESSVGDVRGARIELSRQAMNLPNITMGVRVQGTERRATKGGLGLGDGQLDLEARGAELHGVLRRYFPVTEGIRPYGELFGGLSYNRGDLTVSGSGLMGTYVASDKALSGVGGLGLGLELDLAPDVSAFIQGDYSLRFADVDPFRFRLQDVMIWVGGEIRF